jgi:hypothetical protein
MDACIDVTAIETALERAGISVAAFCRVAEIEQSTWQRLKNSVSKRPRRKTARAVTTALASLGLAPAQADESSAADCAPAHVHTLPALPNPSPPNLSPPNPSSTGVDP